MKILIAEDDVVSRKILAWHLDTWGYEVTETTNGADAWSAFENGEYQMAVLDWMMPGIDGIELVRRIRGARRAGYCYLILLTAKSEKDDLINALECGADDYITKPFDRDELRVRVLAGQRILELQTALMRVEKGAGIGQVALGVSHELSEPIGQVRDNLEILRRETLAMTQSAADSRTEDSMSFESVAALFDRSLEMIVRAQDTLRNLRDFAHADQFAMKPVLITPALHDVAEMVRRLAETKAIDLQLELADVPEINGNAGKLKKVVLHLLVNAVDAVERRGTIALRVSHAGRELAIRVEDNGRGIAPEHLPHIFEPFYALRLPADRRVGLGLAISDAIIREHGGSLEVQSVVGMGTVFTIYLPCLPQPSVDVTIHNADAKPANKPAET